MQIQYIGNKLLKTDNVAGTGLIWNGSGDVQEVRDADAAKKLLAHTGVWASADAGASLSQAKAPPAAPNVPEGGNADPLAGLDDAGVRAFAKSKGLKIQAIGVLKGANLRAKVVAALPK